MKKGTVIITVLLLIAFSGFFVACSDSPIEIYTITFDPQDGIHLSTPSKTVTHGDTYGALPTTSLEGKAFAGWWTEAGGNGEQITAASTVTITADQTLYAKWDYVVGGFGQAGGYVFYDKGSYSDGWRYLEAATSDIDLDESDDQPIFGYYWATVTGPSTSVGGTNIGIGTGEENTAALVTAMGAAAYTLDETSADTTTDYAAKVCADLVVSKDMVEYDDWFLSSKDELNEMYQNLKRNDLGGFSGGFYWSSSESDASKAWDQSFYDGTQNPVNRNFAFMVRPARAF
ncbi:MAG: InlB B-repeat-containing protein [Sphaerochaetaceae bacterium]